jgi:hypothetical protein
MSRIDRCFSAFAISIKNDKLDFGIILEIVFDVKQYALSLT